MNQTSAVFLISLRSVVQMCLYLSHQLQWELSSSPPPSNASCPLSSLERFWRSERFLSRPCYRDHTCYIWNGIALMYTVTGSTGSNMFCFWLLLSLLSNNTERLHILAKDSWIFQQCINISGYTCKHGSLRIGNETLRPLEGAMGTPSAWPVSEAWIKTHNALDIGRWKPMT